MGPDSQSSDRKLVFKILWRSTLLVVVGLIVFVAVQWPSLNKRAKESYGKANIQMLVGNQRSHFEVYGEYISDEGKLREPLSLVPGFELVITKEKLPDEYQKALGPQRMPYLAKDKFLLIMVNHAQRSAWVADSEGRLELVDLP